MSNLPPGVSESMIPGNRPEDAAWDKFYEWLDEYTDQNRISIEELKARIQIKATEKDLSEALEAMYWFCQQVEAGQVRSKETYARYKNILYKYNRIVKGCESCGGSGEGETYSGYDSRGQETEAWSDCEPCKGTGKIVIWRLK